MTGYRQLFVAFENISGNATFVGDSPADVKRAIERDKAKHTDPEHGYPWVYNIEGPYVRSTDYDQREREAKVREQALADAVTACRKVFDDPKITEVARAGAWKCMSAIIYVRDEATQKRSEG